MCRQDYNALLEMLRTGTNLNFIGYDSFSPESLSAEALEATYLDTRRCAALG